MGSYTVTAGDTLWSISQKFGVTLDALRGANPGVGDNLKVGQVLNIPSGGGAPPKKTYTVAAGDTLWAISQKFGVTLEALRGANPGIGDNLKVGQVLNIPGGSGGGGGGSPPPPPDGKVHFYSGPAGSFPGKEHWVSFDKLWAQNAPTTKLSNMWPGNSDHQTQLLHDAILQVAGESKTIDARVILATVMQESQGHVHVPTTISPDGTVRNPGLMQSHNGVEFNAADEKGSITQMVRDGTLGTKFGDGLVQLLAKYGNIYEALRGYNSGSVDKSNLSNGLGATNNYVSDIANRLVGVVPN